MNILARLLAVGVVLIAAAIVVKRATHMAFDIGLGLGSLKEFFRQSRLP